MKVINYFYCFFFLGLQALRKEDLHVSPGRNSSGKTRLQRWNAFSMVILLIACMNTAVSQAQDSPLTVRGSVKAANKDPLMGVGVQVKGAKGATMTDEQGKFRIVVPGEDAILVFSYLGYVTREIKVGTGEMDVVLEPSSTGLNEIVVVGYGTARKADVTSSISSISSKDIKDLPQAGVDQMLQGKVSGVTVSNNGGQPGGGVSVQIRGITTINSNEPLYVIDGVIQESASNNSISYDQLGGTPGQTTQSAIAGLNPNDIETLDVLKDASAQAIYGSRAANGVVIITTKRGKAGQNKVSYDTYYGWQSVPNRLELMDLSEYAAFNNEVFTEIEGVMGSKIRRVPEFQKPGILGEGTNWQDAIFQTGTIQNHQLAFSGGQAKSNYFLSMNYFDQEGSVIGSGYDRYSIRFNMDNEVNSWLKVGLSSNVSRNNQRISLTNGSEGVVNLAVYNSPATPVTTIDGDYATTVEVGGYNFGNAMNPVARAYLREVRKKQNKASSNLYGEIVFSKNFKLRNELNLDYSMIEGMAFQPRIITSQGTVISNPSTLREQRSSSLYLSLVNFLNYEASFQKHRVTAQIGHEVQKTDKDDVVGSRRDLTLNFQTLAAGSQDGQTLNGTKNDWAMESYFARAGYSYDDRYALNLSIRRDGSSSFGPENRIGYFPAASFGWTVSNEQFSKSWKAINYLKFRLGIGAVGNQNAGANSYVTNIRLIATGPFGPGGLPDNIGNPALQWESDWNYNIGLDATLFNRKLEVTIDAYNKETTNMLLPAKLPTFTGVGINWDDIKSPWVNVGSMQNKGIDLGITSYNLVKADFSWTSSLVLSHYKNILKALNTEGAELLRYTEFGNAVLLTRTAAGGPVGRFYGFVTDGLFGSIEEIRASADQGLSVGPTGTWIGDVKYKDLNSDGIIDDKDLTYIGDPNPIFTYGITNSVRYENLDFSLFLQGSYGGEILNYTRRTTEGLRNPYFNQSKAVMNRYSENNPDGNLPRFNQWHNNNWRVSDRFIEDASYLRIQNVTIGYRVPARFSNKVKMNNARIYVTAQNLYTFTNYKGIDPELGGYNSDALLRNVDQGNYPNPRTFNVGLNVTF